MILLILAVNQNKLQKELEHFSVSKTSNLKLQKFLCKEAQSRHLVYQPSAIFTIEISFRDNNLLHETL